MPSGEGGQPTWTPETFRAEAAMQIERSLRPRLRQAIQVFTSDEQEITMIAAGIVAIMVQDMYRQHGPKGDEWLEALIRMVLKARPDPAPPF